MNTIKIENRTVKMIAHRGLSGIECENTNAAFIAAGNRSYYGIECDVHTTKDGKFAIIHDDNTGNVCDTNISVEGSDMEELKSLVLKNPKVDEYRADYKIPELSEYIGVCKKYGKTSVLELKNRIEKPEIEKIIEIIKGEGYIDDVVFISFDWQNMIDVRSIYPKSRVQFLCCKCDDELIERLTQHKIDLDIDKKSVTPELIQKLHERGLEINCWTVDDKEEAERLVSWGVDYITSNILE